MVTGQRVPAVYRKYGSPHIPVDISECAEIGAIAMNKQESQNKSQNQNVQNKNRTPDFSNNSKNSQNKQNNSCND